MVPGDGLASSMGAAMTAAQEKIATAITLGKNIMIDCRQESLESLTMRDCRYWITVRLSKDKHISWFLYCVLEALHPDYSANRGIDRVSADGQGRMHLIKIYYSVYRFSVV